MRSGYRLAFGRDLFEPMVPEVGLKRLSIFLGQAGQVLRIS